ncbi:glycosyltransferase family 4 protein [Acetobacter conturbans]|uniref:Glycosyltransferase n=1 Tax=Acetobacter conturbans TaxID=1737472 RepID=A0ABX0JYR4_9PROT|nr:glycosyltransferase family 1 protein [Acetobacter conturbans]NHN87580.1 glycosyltransferase [Acetobacter conturbans]
MSGKVTMLPFAINGRFATQSLSGVQRFAGELTRSLGKLDWKEEAPVLLAPQGRLTEDEPFDLPVHQFGRLHGQAWEQLELPKGAAGRYLINLGNTAPVFKRDQLVVLHDAAVFAQPEGYSWKFRAWYKLLQTVLCHTTTQIVTVSRFSRDELARSLHIKPSRIGVIPEGSEHISRTTPDTGVLERHNLTGKPFVLAVGNLARHKNLTGLNTLAKRLQEKNIPLVISGGLNTSVFSGGSELPQPAVYVGRVSDAELHALYNAAACFVFPSFYEGFGLPAVEAMACGCPVVAASIPALQEVCADAAVYASPYDPVDISQTVLKVLEDTALAADLREKGRERAKLFTWDNAARALMAIARNGAAR